MTKALLKITSAALALALLMFFSAIYGMKFGAEERQNLLVGQCTAGGQFVIKRSVYKCERVKRSTNREKESGGANDAD